MDPESFKNVPPYRVLAYDVVWPDQSRKNDRDRVDTPGDLVMLDFRAYQRPDQLTDEAMTKVARDLLIAQTHGRVEPISFKIKVIEA